MRDYRSWWRWIAVTLASVALSSAGVRSEESPAQPERVEVGQEAPLFELESLDGTQQSLEALRGESPLVLIFFRGTW